MIFYIPSSHYDYLRLRENLRDYVVVLYVFLSDMYTSIFLVYCEGVNGRKEWKVVVTLFFRITIVDLGDSTRDLEEWTTLYLSVFPGFDQGRSRKYSVMR